MAEFTKSIEDTGKYTYHGQFKDRVSRFSPSPDFPSLPVSFLCTPPALVSNLGGGGIGFLF